MNLTTLSSVRKRTLATDFRNNHFLVKDRYSDLTTYANKFKIYHERQTIPYNLKGTKTSYYDFGITGNRGLEYIGK